jgi:hypothetical protein
MSKSKKKYATYVVTETIVIEQKIFARSEEDALAQYEDMMNNDESRVILTTEGCTESSETSSEIEVETTDDYEERVYG